MESDVRELVEILLTMTEQELQQFVLEANALIEQRTIEAKAG